MHEFLAIFYPRSMTSGSELVLREVSRGAYDGAVACKCPFFVQPVRDLEGAGNSLGMVGMAGSDRLKNHWRALNIPLVNVSNLHGPTEGMANILSDDEAVGRLAAQHLIDKGYRHFLTVGQTGPQWSRERLKGFIGHLQSLDLPVQAVDADLRGELSLSTPGAYMEALWEQVSPHIEPCPLATGIFAANDWLAWPLLQQMTTHCPERVHTTGLLGVDNLHDVLFDPRRTAGLSSIMPGFREAGSRSIRLLLKAIEDGGIIDEVLIRVPPAKLHVRASTAGQACGDPVVSKVVRELWAGLHAGEEPSIQTLARQNGMSLRNMELRFEEHLGQSARALIADMRIQLGQTLLRDTDLPITEISRRCGYSNSTTFSTLFGKKTGQTPRQFRHSKTVPGSG
ncbi:MAG: helix-turn-helix domain-containing protein [Verrucomicrobia bacterium]|nr:helix-turn-helix domain-containing protein [Verrucomicrobiota bacterium]MCH8527976.1 helix-turn-helix domain-containing protein [Kiritimatiellia bacterium]